MRFRGLLVSILGFSLSASMFAQNLTHPNFRTKSIKPTHTKSNKISKITALQNTPFPLKEGIYEFAFTEENSTEIFSWFRILILAEERYPGFRLYGNGVVQTPVAVTWFSPNSNTFKFLPMHLSLVYSNSNNETQIIMATTDGSDEAYVIKLKDETHGELYTRKHGEDKEKNGNVQLTKFINLDDIHMDYFEYNANLSKLDKKLELPEDCPDKNYQGKIGFLQIPKMLSKFADGWIMGAVLQHDDCSIYISQPAMGLLNSNLLGLNGEFIFKSKYDEENYEWRTFEYSSASIIKKPGEFNLKAILNFYELYDSSSPALAFDLIKSSTSSGEESLK